MKRIEQLRNVSSVDSHWFEKDLRKVIEEFQDRGLTVQVEYRINTREKGSVYNDIIYSALVIGTSE